MSFGGRFGVVLCRFRVGSDPLIGPQLFSPSIFTASRLLKHFLCILHTPNARNCPTRDFVPSLVLHSSSFCRLPVLAPSSRQVLAKICLEGWDPGLIPCCLDLLQQLLVLLHELAEQSVLTAAGCRAAMPVMSVGAEQESPSGRLAFDDQLHVGIMTIPQAQHHPAGTLRIVLEYSAVVELMFGHVPQ